MRIAYNLHQIYNILYALNKFAQLLIPVFSVSVPSCVWPFGLEKSLSVVDSTAGTPSDDDLTLDDMKTVVDPSGVIVFVVSFKWVVVTVVIPLVISADSVVIVIAGGGVGLSVGVEWIILGGDVDGHIVSDPIVSFGGREDFGDCVGRVVGLNVDGPVDCFGGREDVGDCVGGVVGLNVDGPVVGFGDWEDFSDCVVWGSCLGPGSKYVK